MPEIFLFNILYSYREIGNNFSNGSYGDLNNYNEPMSLENGMKTIEAQEWTESNTNTLETMSAKSFGSFVRPSPKIREDDIAKRLQRHQSFFDVEHHHHNQSKNRNRNKADHGTPEHNHVSSNPKYHPSPVNVVRRAESFHHNTRSLIDFDYHQSSNNKLQKQAKNSKNNRCESSMDLFGKRYGNENNKPNLHKAKSMEFLKSKLLPRKLPTPNPSPSAASPFLKSETAAKVNGMRNGISHSGALNQKVMCNIGGKGNSNSNLGHSSQPPTSRQRSHSPWSHNRENIHLEKGHKSNEGSKGQIRSSKHHSSKNGNTNDYDWRQDTPFWNGKKPSMGGKAKTDSTSQSFSVSHEEIVGPWQHLQHVHQRSASVNPILSPIHHQQQLVHNHPPNGWHNHPAFAGANGNAPVQYPNQNQGIFLGAMRRFSPTPYLPPNSGQKSSRPISASSVSPSPQSIPSLHLHQPSHFGGIHPVPLSSIMNGHQYFRPARSSNGTPIPSLTPHVPYPVPGPYNTSIINVGSNSNNVSIGMENTRAVSSEKLSDRLEITELSDHEGDFGSPHQPAKSYSKSSTSNGHRNGDNSTIKNRSTSAQQKQPILPAHLRRQQSKIGGISQNKKVENILDMPAGMF